MPALRIYANGDWLWYCAVVSRRTSWPPHSLAVTSEAHAHFLYWYYAMYQYKCNIHNVLHYETLYCYLACNLLGRRSLIKNSAKFKFLQLSSTLMSCLKLHYIIYIIYLFIYFRLVEYIATCTVYRSGRCETRLCGARSGSPQLIHAVMHIVLCCMYIGQNRSWTTPIVKDC